MVNIMRVEKWPRILAHADINAAYASIACLEDRSLRGKCVAVSGDPASRSGIILAASPEAKKFGVRTGQPLWEARQRCPDLVFVCIHDLGRKTIRRVSDDFVEMCYAITPQLALEGDDGVYLDMTGCVRNFEEAEAKAHELRLRMQYEIGVTISVGVSFNRNFAKLASDYRKPNQCTVINHDNWKDIVWPLPVSDLYWIGPATTCKLNRMGIATIGQLAAANLDSIFAKLGVIGRMLWHFANGQDTMPIAYKDDRPEAKTIGNSTTAIKDMETLDDILRHAVKLCEITSESLRKDNLMCTGLRVGLRSTDLSWIGRQKVLPFPSRTCRMLYDQANLLIQKHWNGEPLRGIEVRATGLLGDDYLQMALLPEMLKDQDNERIDMAIQNIHRRMGPGMIVRGRVYEDRVLMEMDLTSPESAQKNAFRRF